MGLKKRVERRQGKVDAARASFGTDNVDGGFDRKLNRLKRSVAKAEKKGINVDYDTTDASGVGRSRTTTSSAPTKMAYAETPSPAANLNKGYGMESNSTEKKDLMKDNPIARDASGSRPVGGSWMSKHSKSMGSPMRMNSPLNDFKGGYHKLQHATGEAHKGSPATMMDDAALPKLTSIERRAARKQGKAKRAQNDADYGKKERKSFDENPAPTGKKKERLQKKADRKQTKADKLMKKADISSESLSKMSDEKRNAIYDKAKKHKNKNR